MEQNNIIPFPIQPSIVEIVKFSNIGMGLSTKKLEAVLITLNEAMKSAGEYARYINRSIENEESVFDKADEHEWRGQEYGLHQALSIIQTIMEK